jgi:hypothetical protein
MYANSEEIDRPIQKCLEYQIIYLLIKMNSSKNRSEIHNKRMNVQNLIKIQNFNRRYQPDKSRKRIKNADQGGLPRNLR